MSKIVHMNYGHGGKDPGGVGNGLQEKNEVLEIGLKASKIIRKHGVIVKETRTTDVFISLHEIARRANADDADIFISLHTNAGGGASANGVEVFSYPNSASGLKLSKDILNQLVEDNIFKTNRGNKTANFAVLRLTKMPSVLVELGFIDHYGDSQIIKNKKDEIALSVAKGILKNIGVKYIDGKIDSVQPAKELYRVRESWEDVNSQAGAYSELSNAILLAKQLNLNVYDSKGKEVYKHKAEDHWGEKPFKELNESGIEIHEKRFDDPITRAESFALAAQLLKKKMN